MKSTLARFACLAILISSTSFAADPVIHRLPDPSEISQAPPAGRTPPLGDELVNPAEFCPADGLFLAWAGWALPFISEIALAVAEDDLVYMLVRDANTEQQAFNYLSSYGVNTDNVAFIRDPSVSATSMWMRDYGPFCAYEDGARAIVDFVYGTYPGDDQIPLTIADHFALPCYESALLHHGGNHITDGNGMAFGSTNLTVYNPGWSLQDIRGEFRSFLGIDSLVIVEPILGDITHHIDMFCKMLDDTLFIVGEYAAPEDGYPGDYERLNLLAEQLAGMQNLDGRFFSVARMPMIPLEYGGPAGRTNRTYTNSQIFNDKVLVPTYNDPLDEVALDIYADLMPDHEIIGIDSSFIIYYAGAVHCVTNVLHCANPLMVLHRPRQQIEMDTAPTLRFTLNPRFSSMSASVFYRFDSEPLFTEIPAAWSGGRWEATLPTATEDFYYYIHGAAASGAHAFEACFPPEAPGELVRVRVIDSSGIASAWGPGFALDCWPNPALHGTTVRYQVPAEGAWRLELLDAGGRLLRRAAAPRRALRMEWPATDQGGSPLPAGVYFLQLTSGAERVTRRLILAD